MNSEKTKSNINSKAKPVATIQPMVVTPRKKLTPEEQLVEEVASTMSAEREISMSSQIGNHTLNNHSFTNQPRIGDEVATQDGSQNNELQQNDSINQDGNHMETFFICCNCGTPNFVPSRTNTLTN